jgi:hypothetical protein
MPFFFLNLSPFEFFAFLAGISGLVTALYFLDRRRRKRVVSTLRFWPDAGQVVDQRSSNKMQQPWSLLMQLLGLLCLLLALAQIQWGTRPLAPKDHVVLVDTSAWATARTNGAGTVLDQEKQLVASYLDSVSPQDRILLVAADALAVPLGKFTDDRKVLSNDLKSIRPGSGSGLDLKHALLFAEAQEMSVPASARGEIVLVGPGYSSTQAKLPANLRTLPVTVSARNVAISAMSALPDLGAQSSWKVLVTIRNTGDRPAKTVVNARFARTRFEPRSVEVAAKQEMRLDYVFNVTGAGRFTAQLNSEPSANLVAIDDSASMTLAAPTRSTIAVYSTQPEYLRPFLISNQAITARFFSPAQYRPDQEADVFVFDRFVPGGKPTVAPGLYIAPPAERAPIPIEKTLTNTRVTRWQGPFLLGSGLHSEDIVLPKTQIFQNVSAMQPVAMTQYGAAAAAFERVGTHTRSVILGFDLTTTQVRLNIASPLLIANALRWLSPSTLIPQTFSAVPIGSVQVGLEPGEAANAIQATAHGGEAVAFTTLRGSVEMFLPRPTAVHLQTSERDITLNAALANAPGEQWASKSLLTGLPSPEAQVKPSVGLWQWLALAGALCLAAEWFLFGRFRFQRAKSTVQDRFAHDQKRLSA